MHNFYIFLQRDFQMPVKADVHQFERFSSCGSSYESPASFDSLDGSKEISNYSEQQRKFSYDQNISVDDLDSIESSLYQTPTSIHGISIEDYFEHSQQNLKICLERISNNMKTGADLKNTIILEDNNLSSITVDEDNTNQTDSNEFTENKTHCHNYSNGNWNSSSILTPPLARKTCNRQEALTATQQQQLPNIRRHSVNIILNPVCQVSETIKLFNWYLMDCSLTKNF